MWSNKPVLTKKTEIKGLLFGRPFRTELPSTQIAGRQGTAMYYPPTIIEFVQSQVLLLPNRKLHKLQPHTNMLQLSQIVSQSHPHTHTPEKLMRHLRHVVFARRENLNGRFGVNFFDEWFSFWICYKMVEDMQMLIQWRKVLENVISACYQLCTIAGLDTGQCLRILSAGPELSLPEGQFRLNFSYFFSFSETFSGLGFLPWGWSSCPP